jgi:AraC family transcriptional regulator
LYRALQETYQTVWSFEIASAAQLIAGINRSLETDPGLARYYLQRLAELVTEEEAPNSLSCILPESLPGHESSTQGGLASWQIRRVIHHIESELENGLRIEDLSGLINLSPGHFCRTFKITMGETAHSFIIRRRIRRAQILMIETRNSLSEIACSCGLADQAHLTRLFRKLVGDTPMNWRRANQLSI